MADEGTGRVLKPANFDVNKFKRAKVQTTEEQSTPDQFGQQYNSDYDRSKWSDIAPAMSRKAHLRSDVDLSPRALHHTLGIKRNQASPGNHNHDGTTSKKIGPLEMDPSNNGQTRPAWTLPASPTVADVVNFMKNFVEFRQV